MVLSFNDVNDKFKEHGCILIMSEDEFNQKKSKNYKYKYIASCTHNNEIRFSDFKNKLSGLKCPKCVNYESSINQIEKYKLNPVSPNDLEFESIEYLKTLIGDTFDVIINGEGCLADCSIKPKHITEDSWLMVQMKSTAKPIDRRRYQFNSSSKYINCIIMCICLSDKKMWVFDGNITTTKCIGIGLTKSKYDKFEITKNTIHERLTYYYNTLPKYDFETIDTPITPDQQLEREYRIYREKMIPCLPFIRNERQGLVYDFMINGLKIQEKVSSKRKNDNGTKFNIDKSNGMNCGKQKQISYQKGDNDFYWLNLNNKQHFYIIPEHELISRNYINIDKLSCISLNPISKRKSKTDWAKQYLFDYTKLTKLDEEKLKIMFQIQ